MNNIIFNPTKYRCKQCGTILQSKFEGHFTSCKCGNFVDQTKYYERCIGNKDDFKIC